MDLDILDVAIIGGGLAGSAAAIGLARQGKKVILLEKEPAAHHKVCGEFISPEAEKYLTSLGLDIEKLGAQTIASIRLICGNKKTEAPLPFIAHSLSRLSLDQNLLSLAEISGTNIIRGVLVTELSKWQQGWKIKCSNGDFIWASSVFLATGKYNLRGWNREYHGRENDMIGFKIHLQLPQLQREKIAKYVEIILFDDGYAGLEPVEEGLANLCLVVKKSRFKQCKKDWQQLLKYISESSCHFLERINGSKACWQKPLSIFTIPYGFVYGDNSDSSEPNSNGLYRLGDQMAVIPSFCGDGMAIALHTAQLAVDNYLNRDSRSYHQQAYADLKPQILRATNISWLIASPIKQRIAFQFCKLYPQLLSKIALQTRLRSYSESKLA